MALPIVAVGVSVLFGGHISGKVDFPLQHKTDSLTFVHVSVLTCLTTRPKEPNRLGPLA